MAVSSTQLHAGSRARPSPAVADSAFDIVETKPPNHVSFYIRVRASGALFLVVPARCPTQPRFWCFWVHRCLASGVVDSSQVSWSSPEQLRREELAEAAMTIHDDVDGWLRNADQTALRSWLVGHEGDSST